LAGELGLAGVRALVLERQPQIRETPRAYGLGGQILELLRYRGLLDRFEAAATGPIHAAPRVPFGGVHVDLAQLADPPLRALGLPQPRLEQVLDERAHEMGADIRRGHDVTGVGQDDTGVTADVAGHGRVTARYLVGCDGGRSRVRSWAGIPFPGTTYPEVNRLAQLTIADSVTVRDDGDVDVPGLGRVPVAAFTRTGRGVFSCGRLTAGELLVQTTEDEAVEYDDDVPMTMAELQASIRRVLGAELPATGASRLSRYQFQARQAERYRDGRVFLAGDAAHLLPATGAAINLGMLDTVNLAWKLAAAVHGRAPAGLLDTYDTERRFAGARALRQAQAQVALRRGQDAAADALRDVVEELLADAPAARRVGAMIAGADVRYPGTGHPLTGTFAPDLTLHTDQGTSSVAALLRPAHPVLLDLAGRPDLRETGRGWQHVHVVTAKTDERPADALLIRPDATVAWAGTDEPTLREALTTWFGTAATLG
ncbi:MAG TPA: FAD-dependent monooxygenase, partial [Pseudonocardiaceae bacterium]|nr:FAD-dependent monooxygenase [Pseudonocardiaceae bacterium]